MGDYPLYISEGDPVGISPELISQEIHLLEKISKKRNVVLFSSSYFKYEGFQRMTATEYFANHITSKASGLIEVIPDKDSPLISSTQSFQMGKPSRHTGASAFHSLKNACSSLKLTQGDLITLPLSKEWVIASGEKKFTGHTEFLGDFFKKSTFMLMHGKKWNIIPLTTHIPLKRVSSELKKVDWSKLKKSILSSSIWKSPPSIGFLGLNPHAGEGGKVGDEELKIHTSMIQKWKKSGMKVEGPLSADSSFTDTSPKYDIYLACYHDQGLIPFKMLEGKHGINVTLGLPFTRVSPDHGTAFNIAGKGSADSTSLRECLNFFEKRSCL